MPTILTYTGRKFDLLNPDPSMICIEDIAHALSLKCRWGGHTSRFYSVAEHSLNVMSRVSEAAKFEALLHDAAEAYLGDIASPFKDSLYIERNGGGFASNWLSFRGKEREVDKAICEAFGIPFTYKTPHHDEVKKADLELQGMEGAALFKTNPVPELTWVGNSCVGRTEQLWSWPSPAAFETEMIIQFERLKP